MIYGQNVPVTQSEVRAELQRRGIAEQDLLDELNARGIDIQDFENLTPAQIVEIEQIVNELEAQRANSADTPNQTLEGSDEMINKEEFLEAPTQRDAEGMNEEVKRVVENKVDSTEKIPNIYGHAFFKNRDLSVFETSTEVKAPENYILGAGDKIVISIFGISRAEFAHEIDSDGYIVVNNRRIFLKGLTLGAAKRKLYETLSRFYRFGEGEFDVSISYSRTININIQGEVMNPGGYTLSAINNVFNGLVAAGGPTEIGSLRDVLLIKKGGAIINLDFYSYLQNPNNITDSSLEQGDVIVVPVARKIVQIRGGVRRPMRYELKENENFSDLLVLAGGYTSNANRQLIQVSRSVENGRRLLDIRGQQIAGYELQDGDVVTIRKVENELDNYVEIKGAVINVGEYERTDDLLLGDLINIAILQPGARKDVAFIRRTEDNGRIIYLKVNLQEGQSDLQIPLQNRDAVTVFSESTFNDNQQFQVSGAVRNPGSFNLALGQSITIADAIELAGGLRRDASTVGIIHTKDPLNPKLKHYTRIDLNDILADESTNFLTALDSLEIFSESLFSERSSVNISGAVNNPGEFQYGVGMTLADVLTMSGGFMLGAATNHVEISRLVIENNEPTKTLVANLTINRDLEEGDENLAFELMPYDEIMVRFVPDFELQKIVTLEGEVRFPGEYSLIKDNETVRELIIRAGGITSEAFPTGAKLFRTENNTGVVVIKLDDVLEMGSSRFNFKLRDGDRIEIPKSKEFVSIVGATNASKLYNKEILGGQNQLNVPYHKGKDARFYIENYAGGISDSGSPNEIYVEDANGEITRTKNYLIYKNYPDVEMGSKIVVGNKPVKTQEEKDREDVDWSRVLADSVGQAVSILSLILLIERI